MNWCICNREDIQKNKTEDEILEIQTNIENTLDSITNVKIDILHIITI